MENNKTVAIEAGISGAQRLRLKQLLNDAVNQLSDQLTQIEQNIAQCLPDLGAGLTNARNMRELESLLKELVSAETVFEYTLGIEAIGSAAKMSWQEERSFAQAREQALHKSVANLLQATWLGTMLKKQSLLTEGLIATKVAMGNREGCKGEKYH